jgi:hypothetical protein
MSFFDPVLKRLGYIPKSKYDQLTNEMILADVPEKLRGELKGLFDDVQNIKIVSNPNLCTPKYIRIGELLAAARTYTKEGGPVDRALKLNKGFLRSNGNVFGYSPAGAKIWGHFVNPMQVFSYLYDNWWALKRVSDIIETEVESGGFVLKAAKGVSEKRILEIYKLVKMLGIDELFVDSVVDLVRFGNSHILPHTGAQSKQTVKLERLRQNDLYPLMSNKTYQIVGYEYQQGLINEKYPKEKLIHIALSSGSGIGYGTPPALPAVTDIEGALYASMLNNTIFQKGGILGVIVALERPKDDQGINTGNTQNNDWVDLVQDKLNSEAGARGGHGMLAMTDVAGVHKMSEAGSIDKNWGHGTEYAAKITAESCGMPPEKLGLVRSSALQYSPALVEDTVNAEMDATINRLTAKVARKFNTEIMEGLLGITDVKLMPVRRTGAKTKTATEALKNLADVEIITKNEGRTGWLHMEAFPGPEGDEFLTSVAKPNADGTTPTARTPQQSPDPDFATLESPKSAGKKGAKSYQSIMIHVGGVDDGQIRKQYA